jgi:hypothetical protein
MPIPCRKHQTTVYRGKLDCRLYVEAERLNVRQESKLSLWCRHILSPRCQGRQSWSPPRLRMSLQEQYK